MNDPESSCFCRGNKCLKKGLGNIRPCYYSKYIYSDSNVCTIKFLNKWFPILDIPLAISFPHFFNADPTLLDPIEGLKPDEALHGTEIAIQPVSVN